MQFIDLKAQYASLKARIDARIQAVLDHGHFIMGPEVAALEDELSAYTGAKHAITCANGTDALQLALMVYGIGPGDIVFTTPFTFFATAETIALVGATPVFVDIDPDTFNIDPDKLEEAIAEHQPGTAKAVISVDLFGLPADYTRLEHICQHHGLKLIEDAAQGFGGSIEGRRAGTFGDLATTSFFPAKPLGCYGDGGALFTDDDEVAELLRSLRFHGKGADKYDNVRIGLNSRLDTLQAAILLEKLAAFPSEAKARQTLADYYTSNLGDRYKTPFVPHGYQSIWAQYSLIAEDSDMRTRLQSACKARDIPTMVYYPRPMHLLGAFTHLGYKAGDFPASEDVARRIFSLPMHPYMQEDAAAEVVDCLLSAN
ncbi:DegT/DnrJ/EryC1/StrS family aminotransferase [Kordiimonas sp.]|uniref:DegT/DnrJ/EryC1/StrS family aminotransferase n=1 Tax=Kordiimonas sp. TaxID=1970157 RepID=UPI003A922F15